MPRVIVLGGGIAGLSAAQELAERRYEVVVLERRHVFGGKARSIEAAEARLGPRPATGRATRGAKAWVPGEHGFRFFPGFYKHIIHSMTRIPAGEGHSVADNLVSTTRFGMTQYDDHPMFEFPSRFSETVDDVRAFIRGAAEYVGPVTGLTFEDLVQFGGRLWQIMTSCDERRLAEYEKQPWWSFVGADARSDAYRKFMAQSLTRSVVAARAEAASARTIGNTFIQMGLTLFDPSRPAGDRVLNGPTSAVWLDHWLSWLQDLGVELREHAEVRSLLCDQQGITGVVTSRHGQTEVVEGDYYICAIPVERAARLVTSDLAGLDPGLALLPQLAENVEWMNGIQIYLRRRLPLVHGHVIHLDTEWALTSVSQAQFWRPGTLTRYGNPDLQDIVSVDISNWEAPGLSGRLARDCSREEVYEEVWNQLKRSVNREAEEVLSDADVVGWFLDPDIRPDPTNPSELTNTEALLVNQIDTWRLRPEAVTAIRNLFLASDYVRTYTDLATMEGANEAARRAVNGILDDSKYAGPFCEIWPLEEVPALAPWREYDAARFRLGLSWDSNSLDLLSSLAPTVEPLVNAALDALQELMIGTPTAVHRPEFPSAPTSELPAPIPRSVAQISQPAQRATADPGPGDLRARMAWYRERTLNEIAAQLPPNEHEPHLYGLIRGFLARPSKGIRPALCLATCGVLGGDPNIAVLPAAGLELLHDAFLVHDDIEDDSNLRSGQPSLHKQVGVPIALNVGDAMNALAMRFFWRSMAGLGFDDAALLAEEVDHLLTQTLEGQALELAWVRDKKAQIGVDEYLRVVLKKTSWYSFIHPMRIGALFAHQPDRNLDGFNRFGCLLGAAFQVQDDVLNLTGAVSRYGKEIGADLWEGKPTLIVAHALAHGTTNQRERLRSLLTGLSHSRLPRHVSYLYEILDELGSIDWAKQAARYLAEAAQAELPSAIPEPRPGPDLDFIRSLAGFVTERDL
jgi:geranylgeranyl pyrophosphate synthase/uncharacterized protein with NAD-binding domain and iron-sulfur cluster